MMRSQASIRSEQLQSIFRKQFGQMTKLPKQERMAISTIVARVSWFAHRFLEHAEEEDFAAAVRELDRLVAIIRKGDSDAASTARLQKAVMEVGELAPFAHAPSVEAVGRLLSHPDFLVRIAACQSLGRIGGESANERLLQALQDSNPKVANVARESLYLNVIGMLAESLKAAYEAERTAETPLTARAGSEREPSRETEQLPAEGKSRGETESEWETAAEADYEHEEERNIKAFDSMAAQLVEKHPGQFLAFCEGEFVAHDPDIEELKLRLAKMLPGRPVLIVEPEGADGGNGDQGL